MSAASAGAVQLSVAVHGLVSVRRNSMVREARERGKAPCILGVVWCPSCTVPSVQCRVSYCIVGWMVAPAQPVSSSVPPNPVSGKFWAGDSTVKVVLTEDRRGMVHDQVCGGRQGDPGQLT